MKVNQKYFLDISCIYKIYCILFFPFNLFILGQRSYICCFVFLQPEDLGVKVGDGERRSREHIFGTETLSSSTGQFI